MEIPIHDRAICTLWMDMRVLSIAQYIDRHWIRCL